MSKPIKHEVKYKCLQKAITAFSVEIGFKASKEEYNKAWTRLWKTINKIGLFRDAKK